MALNKQSNLYTIIYIVVMVLVVGVALAATAMSLRSRQDDNAAADKMKQILAAVHIVPESDAVIATFDSCIVAQKVYDSEGAETDGEAFDIDVEAQSKLPDAERKLPVYTCRMADGAIKYIIPVYGAGLWGPIWGYVAFDADGSTVYGAYFAHQGETPGLGAEIEKPAFCDQFDGKHVIKDGHFAPIAVVKAGQKPIGDEDYVDGVSGGTITSKGVSEMLSNCLTPYSAFLTNLGK
ncbi:MAG: NADH:ubiquinone reductase (Na(+)-transporting) subunit C [Muribaculaceae bacterium]|nr:NADH:ubiquinone reductase (Na(+)-transporting) subunit C [Muribaculaceae bacterium]